MLKHPSMYFGQNKNMFGIDVSKSDSRLRRSEYVADQVIDNECIVDNLRVSTYEESYCEGSEERYSSDLLMNRLAGSKRQSDVTRYSV